ncbi:MAG: glycosyltransferase [Phycisphaerales bacterium]|jgi:cellulose synthase/poly-beta-1,6-N-acetylglucosamine synthase-like glycosyltransferase|nr:glycosyltransferase [Phycisphaerales bacterium]
MSIADVLQTAFMSLYTFVLVMVSIYGLHRYVIVYLFLKHRKKTPQPAGQFEELPRVTVQLPMYNEETVAQRIIEEAARIDYPSDKLQIQVIDDSTDDTCRIAQETVARLKAQGVDIQYLHRDDRTGYKAGALDAAMPHVTGEFITIFDADFIPRADVLQDSIQHFVDPDVCVVQTRWEHLNREDSWLTKAQAIFLDGHFAIEHVARNRSERFMSFNGTAGTWRKTAIAAAGGWHHDTLTEDLDLSYRAQLKGWKFVFLPEVTAPAELPPEMNAFKAQQFRWTKGGAQVAIKLLPKIMMSKAPLKVKIESFFHLTGFCLHIYMFALVLMLFPAIFLRTVAVQDGSIWRSVIDMGVFVLATMSAFVFYLASQLQLSRDWRTVFKFMPMLMALGVGICISNSKAIIEAIAGKQSEFVRTPKYGRGGQAAASTMSKRKSKKLLPYIEFAFGVYMTICAVFSLVYIRAALTAPFLLIFAFGFFYVSILSFQAERASSPVEDKATPVEEPVIE